jgi:hypothetical protein
MKKYSVNESRTIFIKTILAFNESFDGHIKNVTLKFIYMCELNMSLVINLYM